MEQNKSGEELSYHCQCNFLISKNEMVFSIGWKLMKKFVGVININETGKYNFMVQLPPLFLKEKNYKICYH